MAIAIIAALYGLMFLLLKAVASLDMNNEVRLAFNIIGGIGALVVPILIYSFIDMRLTQRAVNIVGQLWCQENDVEFNKVEMYKNHFALIYHDGGEKYRKKFRVRFIFTTWLVKGVEWINK